MTSHAITPRPEYGEEIARGFDLTAADAKEMILKLVGSRS